MVRSYQLSEDAVAEVVLGEADRLEYWRPSPGRDFDVFLFGIRGPGLSTRPWDDRLGCIWWEGGRWRCILARGTTDPGRDGAGGRQHQRGVAVHCAGRHRAVWTLGIHARGRRSEHRALVQRSTPPVWRDSVGDGRLDDLQGPYVDVTGLNMHGPWRGGLERVGDASHGCQVWHRMQDLERVLDVCRAQVEQVAVDTFSYALFTLRPVRREQPSPALAALLGMVQA